MYHSQVFDSPVKDSQRKQTTPKPMKWSFIYSWEMVSTLNNLPNLEQLRLICPIVL